ncbi:MAG: YdeI/OmpD-associated family protein [Betaproteobacteria bacterium]
MQITHFKTSKEFRAWLKTHHAQESELLVGFYRKNSGLGGLTYAEALDEALCFGWIDGVRRKIDDETFTIRFSPRKPSSIWSNINVAHVARLLAAKRMTPAGIKVYEARKAHKTGIYSFEQTKHAFEPAQEAALRKHRKAWAFWEAQPPGYKRIAMHWATSAKQEATRARRIAILIEDSAAGRRLSIVTGKKN